MATSNRCSSCEKAAGAYFCTGCKAYFCMKDLKSHHGQLLNDLDVFAEDRNVLQEEINKITPQNHSANEILLQIDEWQKVTIAKVEEAADRARQQVTTILNSKHKEITTKFDTFSKELAHMKYTEEFVHDDLTRLQQMIQDLNEDLKQFAHPSTVELRTEQSNRVDWNRLVYAEQKVFPAKPQQLPKQTIEQQQPPALFPQSIFPQDYAFCIS